MCLERSERNGYNNENYLKKLAQINYSVDFPAPITLIPEEKIQQSMTIFDDAVMKSLEDTEFSRLERDYDNFYIITYETDQFHMIASIKAYMPNPVNDKAYLIEDLSVYIESSSIDISDLDNKGNGNLLFILEKRGAFVLEKSIGEKIDAYSLWTGEERPFIILGNLKKSSVRRNFDLAHELGHLLLHNKVEFSLLDKKSYSEFENEANYFAEVFLLPEEEFKKDFSSIPKNSNPNSYLDLKKKMGCLNISISISCAFVRFIDLSII